LISAFSAHFTPENDETFASSSRISCASFSTSFFSFLFLSRKRSVLLSSSIITRRSISKIGVKNGTRLVVDIVIALYATLCDSVLITRGQTPKIPPLNEKERRVFGVVFVIVSSSFLFVSLSKMTTFFSIVSVATSRVVVIMRSMCFASSSSKTASSCVCARRRQKRATLVNALHRGAAFRDRAETSSASCGRSSFARGETSIVDHPGNRQNFLLKVVSSSRKRGGDLKIKSAWGDDVQFFPCRLLEKPKKVTAKGDLYSLSISSVVHIWTTT